MYPLHATPTPAQGHSHWSGIAKPEGAPFATSLHGIDSQQSFSGCPSARNMKQFSVLHGDAAGPFSQSTFQSMLKATPSAESSSRIFAQAFDSDCALSLLSAAAQDSGIGQMPPAGRIAMRQPPLASDLAYATAQASCYAPVSGSGGAEDGTVGDVFVCEAAGAGLHCQCVYNAMGGGGPPEEASQALPFFSWQ